MTFFEFRKKTMPESKTYPGRHPFLRKYVVYFMQMPAAPFSYILVKFPWVTPNRVSILRMVLSVGVIFLFLGSENMIILGLLLAYFALFSDCIDGQIARYRGTDSLEGAFVDSLTSRALEPALIISLGVVIYNWSGEIWGILLSAIILGLTSLPVQSYQSLILKYREDKERSTIPFNKFMNTASADAPRNNDIKIEKYTFREALRYFILDGHFVVKRVFLVTLLGILGYGVMPLYVYLYIKLFFCVKHDLVFALNVYNNKLVSKKLIEIERSRTSNNV